MKLNYNNQLESNQRRANEFVQAFVNGKDWNDHVTYLDRISRMTKQDIMAFARKHFADNYVAVYKKEGVDNTQNKINKPQITAMSLIHI